MGYSYRLVALGYFVYHLAIMKRIVKRWLFILLILCIVISFALGIYLFVTRPEEIGGFSLSEGPLDLVELMNQEQSSSGESLPILAPEDAVPEKERGVLLTGDDFSASILKDGRAGVGLDIADDIDWDISFDVNPWEDKYSFTTEWTLHL